MLYALILRIQYHYFYPSLSLGKRLFCMYIFVRPPWLASGFPATGSSGTGRSKTVPGQGQAGDEAAYTSQCGSGGPLTRIVVTGRPLATAPMAVTPGVRIVSPADEAVFAPGDTVEVTIIIDDPTLIGGAFLGGVLGSLSLLQHPSHPYEMSLPIPDEASGRFSLRPYSYDAAGNRHDGPSIDLIVRPTTMPEDLDVSEYFKLVLPEPTGISRKKVSVVGLYPNDMELNLGESALGTTYTSSNEAVVEVDAEGVITPIAAGHAVVTTQAMGHKDFTVVKVEQDSIPLLPEDVTHRFEMQKSGIRLNRRTGFYVQRITVRNVGIAPVPGPLVLVLSNLPNGVVAVNREGTTDNIVPGSPMFDIPLSGNPFALLPGEVVSFTVEYLNPNRQRLIYTAQIFLAENP